MKKPKPRPVQARASDNDKRAFREPMLSDVELRQLARRARYAGSGKHKFSPRAFDLEPAPRDTDDTMCDAHAGFTPADMARARGLLRRGVLAGLVGHNEKQGDPTVLWTIDDSGWVYEARITTPTQAIYHGYPLLRGDAFAKKVIARYRVWAYSRNKPRLLRIHENALDLYR